MPHYSIYEFSEPKFVEYESYHLTWCDDSYDSGAPYGEPISPYQHDLFYEPSSLAYPEEVDFTGQFWNEYGLTDKACKELPLQLPYNGNNNGLGEYASYFDGHWEEDISHEYGAFDYEFGQHEYSLEKAEDTYRGEERYDCRYSCDENREKRPAHDYNSWLGNGFTLGYEANEQGTREYEPLHREYEPWRSHNVYEMRLCERIFGYWLPSTTDQESSVSEAYA